MLFDINDNLFFLPCRKSALYVVKFISLIINILFYGFCVLINFVMHICDAKFWGEWDFKFTSNSKNKLDLESEER